MPNYEKVFVFADKPDALAELFAGGQILADQVCALAYSQETEDKAKTCGVDAVFRMEGGDGRVPEDYLETMWELVAKEKPGLVFIRGSKRGKLIAGRLAAALGGSALTDVVEVLTESDKLQVKRIVYGGAAMRTLEPKADTVVMTVGGGLFEAQAGGTFEGQVSQVDFVEPKCPIKRIEQKAKEGRKVDLVASKKIVGVGRGFDKQDDLSMAYDLAGLISAEVGCSRPIAEVEHWLPKENYIGVSGAMIKPDIYLAVGISGQVQHMFGVSQAHTIIAINKDKNAPIFQQADYGIVGDLYEVVPALLEKLRAG